MSTGALAITTFLAVHLQSIKADKENFRFYILECVKVIGERISDLVAITDSFAEWKVSYLELYRN